GLLRHQDDGGPALGSREERGRQTLEELAPPVGAALPLAVEEQDERPAPCRVVVARDVDEVGHSPDLAGVETGRGGWRRSSREDRRQQQKNDQLRRRSRISQRKRASATAARPRL